MVLGAFLFALMAVCVKLASAGFNAAELVFYRGVIGIVVLGAITWRQKVPLATRYPGMHIGRSIAGVLSLLAWYYALGGLPVATAMTLNYMSGVWVAVFVVAGTLMGWRPDQGPGQLRQQVPLAAACLAGFGGVVLVLQPAMVDHQFQHALLGLMSGVFAAIAYLQVSALTRIGEPESRVVFYFTVGGTVGGALAMTVLGVSPWSWTHALWLLPMGLFASLGQLCMTYAYSSGATLVVACLSYFAIVFSALFGLLLFDDQIPPAGWAGMALIIGSGILASVLRARPVPTPSDAASSRTP